MRAVVACFGNLLRGDDGFGIVVAERLHAAALPSSVQVVEVGIGGIHLVQDLLDPADVLVVVDALDVGRPPGTVVVTIPDVVDVDALSPHERRDQLADMHYATPARALMLARGLGVLPPTVWLVGAQVGPEEQLGQGVSPAVGAAVDAAVREVHSVLAATGALA